MRLQEFIDHLSDLNDCELSRDGLIETYDAFVESQEYQRYLELKNKFEPQPEPRRVWQFNREKSSAIYSIEYDPNESVVSIAYQNDPGTFYHYDVIPDMKDTFERDLNCLNLDARFFSIGRMVIGWKRFPWIVRKNP